MGITIKDIAKRIGVSHTTVSRALNDSPLISVPRKIEIQKVASELGYQPNLKARSLVLNKTYNIGLYFSTLDIGVTSNFIFEILTIVEKAMPKLYNIVVRSVEDIENDKIIDHKNYDGIILVSQSESDNYIIDICSQKNLPLVVINRKIEEVSSYYCDEEKIFVAMVNYLVTKNYKNIAFIGGKKGTTTAFSRLKGYKNGIQNNHLKVRIYEGNYSVESGYDATDKILKLDQVDAIICANDAMALGCYKKLQEKGVNIGKDVGVVGFDNTPMDSFLFPSLSSIERPLKEMVFDGSSHLLTMIEKHRIEIKQKEYELKIVLRDSIRS